MRRILTSWFPSRRIADLEREVRTLTGERDYARSEVVRVTQQRDELRRVIGDVRSYARQEAERAVAENLARRTTQVLPTRDRPSWAMHRDDPAVYGGMRPTVALAAHLDDQRPPDLTACYHPAEDSSMEAFRHRCHGTHEPCPPEGHQ